MSEENKTQDFENQGTENTYTGNENAAQMPNEADGHESRQSACNMCGRQDSQAQGQYHTDGQSNTFSNTDNFDTSEGAAGRETGTYREKATEYAENERFSPEHNTDGNGCHHVEGAKNTGIEHTFDNVDHFNESQGYHKRYQEGQAEAGHAQTGNGSYDYTKRRETYHSPYQDYQGGYRQQDTGYCDGGSANQEPKKEGFGTTAGIVVLSMIAAAAVGVAAGIGINNVRTAGAQTKEVATTSKSKDSSSASSSKSSSKLSLKTTETTSSATDVTDVVENVMPSVVSVYSSYTATTQDFFGQTYSQEATSAGTGFIVSQDDDTNELLIVTNNHVVEDADSLEVQFIDESTAKANIKGTDSANDLAVIAVDLDDLDEDTLDEIKIATIGDSDSAKIGEPVIAIGNSLGYGQSVTTGVVSALERELEVDGTTNTFVQTDAAINPGNSGGPLVDLNGNVIGINSNKIGGDTVDSMGFAIPISRAVPIIENLMNQKTKTAVDEDNRGYLGVSGISVTSEVADAYDLPEGVYIAQILEGGAAEDSDLQKGDIIVAIEGSTVSDMDSLQKQLSYYAAGEDVTFTVKRQDGSGEYKKQEVTITLGDKSAIEASESQGSEENSKHVFGYNNGGASKNTED